MNIFDVIRHLAVHGPARNDQEREKLLAAVDAEERGGQPQPDIPHEPEGGDQP